MFLTLFVLNDFLPHMLALDIADKTFSLLFHEYKRVREKFPVEYLKGDKGGITCFDQL